MIAENIGEYIQNLHGRFEELETALADPATYSNGTEFRRLSQEHHKLGILFQKYNDWCKANSELAENHKMLSSEADADLRDLITADIAELEEKAQKLESDIQILLLPPDPNDARNIIVGIKPAAGGDEAALFANELFRTYLKFAEKNSWRVEVLSQSYTELGGVKDVSFSLTGDKIYSLMKYEAGVHRVQRVPTTETGGRLHTSTVTVAVMPEAEAVELDINPEDLRFDVFRSSGPGGQCVNTTDSAVRVTHIPTGIAVASQQEKSQHRNKEIALRILYARLLEHKQQEAADKQAADKRSQVGTGDRSERIRTYNFPQNRVTDHRYNVSTFDLPKYMEGNLELLLDQIIKIACEQRIDQLGLK